MHPRETNFTDLAGDQKNLIFVDVSNVWKKQAASRETKNIRKILLHHHAGFPHDMTEKHKTTTAASGELMPKSYVDIADWAEYATRPLGYHYDIPFFGETSADGKKNVVYLLSHHDRNTWHTGANQNEIGIGVSLVGYMRTQDKPYGENFSKAAQEYKDNKGLPSKHQLAVLPVLVRFLQEMHNVADGHVQAHFQHGKPACPGFDTEYWLLNHEDTPRRRSEGFCYPVAIQSGATAKPFLKSTDKELARAKEYLLNTVQGRSGLFPFGRRHFWHNGIHLFPPGGAGSPVYAVRDGWVVGARFDKKIIVDEIDYGSANFVAIHHEDPGLYDERDKRPSDQAQASGKWRNVIVHPTYFSLYMHLKPLDEALGWVKALKDKDSALFNKIQGDKQSDYSFHKFALPVKTGEIIGYVGTHDPFAALPKDTPVAAKEVFDAKNHAVLHFEMFSGYNLVERLDPDTSASASWTIRDDDANALAEAAASKLEQKVAGLKEVAPDLKKGIEDMEAKDPRYADPSLWSTVIDERIHNALSCVITNHVSEWNAQWKKVLDGWFREWGLVKGKETKEEKKDREKKVKHALAVVNQFQFKWKLPSFSWRKPAVAKYPYYYHPIRLLNWLNGMERVADVALSYNSLEGVTPFDIAPRKVRALEERRTGATDILISAKTGKPEVADSTELAGTRIAFPPSKQYYHVETVQKEAGGLRLTFRPPLAEDVKKGATMKLGGRGWRWEAKFAWDSRILGS